MILIAAKFARQQSVAALMNQSADVDLEEPRDLLAWLTGAVEMACVLDTD